MLLLVFVGQLFTVNKPLTSASEVVAEDGTSQQTTDGSAAAPLTLADQMAMNIEQIDAMQQGDISALETSVQKLDAKDGVGLTGKSKKAWYKKKFKNCVVVGDSLTEGLSVYGWLSKSQVFSDIGASIISSKSLFTKAAKTYPKAAFFAFGMNDLGNYSGDADKFVKDYEKLLKKVHKKSPKTKIYVCSITTPTKAAIKDKKMLGNYKKFNKAIKAMCKKNKWTYIDDSGILPANKKLYAEDGIHAASDYYPLWMDMMIQKANL